MTNWQVPRFRIIIGLLCMRKILLFLQDRDMNCLIAIEKGWDLCSKRKHAEAFQSKVLLCPKVDTGNRGLLTDLPTCRELFSSTSL